MFQGKVDKLIVGEHSELFDIADTKVHFRKVQASEERAEAVFQLRNTVETPAPL